ncbi:hypothetical protein BHM03_00022079 [Ensete ventricosum]|nr:hypothetical protein BHM03_00022079 [Ensete ventricosum]
MRQQVEAAVVAGEEAMRAGSSGGGGRPWGGGVGGGRRQRGCRQWQQQWGSKGLGTGMSRGSSSDLKRSQRWVKKIRSSSDLHSTMIGDDSDTWLRRDRYIVNRDEGLTVVDFSDHVSLAKKEGAGMVGRGDPAWGMRS